MGEKTVSLGVWEWVMLGSILFVLFAHSVATDRNFRELKQQCVEQNGLR